MSVHRLFLSASVSALALVSASAVQAQSFYAGLGVEQGSGSLFNDSTEFDTDHNSASLIAGYRHDLANNYFVAGEFEAGRAMEFGINNTPQGQMDSLIRARALGGYSFGNIGVFGALGYTSARGDFFGNGSDTSLDGFNIGLGTEFRASDRVKLRVEAISDRLTGNVSTESYDWDNTSVRAAALFTF